MGVAPALPRARLPGWLVFPEIWLPPPGTPILVPCALVPTITPTWELSITRLTRFFRGPMRFPRIVVPVAFSTRTPASLLPDRRMPGPMTLSLPAPTWTPRSEEHTSELQSLRHLVC